MSLPEFVHHWHQIIRSWKCVCMYVYIYCEPPYRCWVPHPGSFARTASSLDYWVIPWKFFFVLPCGYLHFPLTWISLQIQMYVAKISTSGEGSEVIDCEDLTRQVKTRECFLRGIIELSGQEGGIFPEAWVLKKILEVPRWQRSSLDECFL